MKNMKNINKKMPNKHDKCVLCGETTEYAEMDHVFASDFYVNGIGQLCQSCFDEEYRSKPKLFYKKPSKPSTLRAE